MSTMDKLPKVCVSKQSLNKTIIESFSKYDERTKVVLEWFGEFQCKTLDRIERLRKESETHTNEMSVDYQLNILIKISGLLFRLEEIRLKYLDKCMALDIPDAPDLQKPLPEKKDNLEFRRLAEMILVANAKYGIPVNEIVGAWYDATDAAIKAQEMNQSKICS